MPPRQTTDSRLRQALAALIERLVPSRDSEGPRGHQGVLTEWFDMAPYDTRTRRDEGRSIRVRVITHSSAAFNSATFNSTATPAIPACAAIRDRRAGVFEDLEEGPRASLLAMSDYTRLRRLRASSRFRCRERPAKSTVP